MLKKGQQDIVPIVDAAWIFLKINVIIVFKMK